MSRSILADAFGHHVWATIRLIDACTALTPEELELPAAGTFGSIQATLGHLLAADADYLKAISEGTIGLSDDEAIDALESLDLRGMRSAMEDDGRGWERLLAGDLDPDRIVVRVRPDGTESHVPLGVRLAQVIHHGTDHRSQVCTALTALGHEPPSIDVWDYALATGRTIRDG